MGKDNLHQEFFRRQTMWNDLLKQGGSQAVPAKLLGQLRMYGGGAGIWVDKATTEKSTEDGFGITVSLTHSGKSYPDDFSETEVIYHYPQTARPKRRDSSEIEATKNAARLGFPVFVIIHMSHSTREVRLGLVTDWDDTTKRFLVTFTERFPNGLRRETNVRRPIQVTYSVDEVAARDTREGEVQEDMTFVLFNHERGKQRLVTGRKNQTRFKFYVVKRYGLSCAVCGLDIEDLLQAAHIVPKEDNGSDDPRNGLVLCANHHLAFDAGYYVVHPESFAICYRMTGPDGQRLQIVYKDLNHLSSLPRAEALQWRYERWQGKQSTDSSYQSEGETTGGE